MRDEEIVEIVQGIVGNVLQMQVNLHNDDLNLFDLGLDSMSIVDFLAAIEDEFGVELPEDELNEDVFTSSRRMVELIKHNLPES